MIINAVLVTSIAISPDTTGWLLQKYFAMDHVSLVAVLVNKIEREWHKQQTV